MFVVTDRDLMMKACSIILLLSSIFAFSVNAADEVVTKSTANAANTTTEAAASKGTAAGIDTAFAASAGGITATVVAVGVAAIVIGVAVSDSGGGDDPAPPVTAAVN